MSNTIVVVGVVELVELLPQTTIVAQIDGS